MAEEEGVFSGLLGQIRDRLRLAPESLLFQAGLAGLAQPSVHRYKRGPLEAIGGALQTGSQNATLAQRAAAENKLDRERLTQAQQEREGIQKFQEWMTENPNATMEERMNAVMKFNPEIAAKGYASNLGNPTLAIEAARLQQQLDTGKVEGQAKALELEQAYGGIRQNWEQQHAALAAFKTLKGIEGGETALKASGLSELASSATGFSSFLDAVIKKGGARYAGVPEKDFDRVMEAVFTINKATENISANEQGAVAGQARAARGMGATPGTPLAVRERVYQTMFDETNRLLKATGWEAPEGQRYGFEGPEPAAGVAGTTGEVVAQPGPEVNTPHPQQRNVPLRTPTKITTKDFGINPYTGQTVPRYKRRPEAERDAAKLKAAGYTHVLVTDEKTGIEYVGVVE